MPTIFHQLILQFLYRDARSRLSRPTSLGIVVISGYKVRLRARKYREPDILFIKTAHRSGIKEQYCEKADIVIEVVSDQNRPHDIKTKRVEYAKAGIPEYWIIDPERQRDHGPGTQIKAKGLHGVRCFSQRHNGRVETASGFHGGRDNCALAEAVTEALPARLTTATILLALLQVFSALHQSPPRRSTPPAWLRRLAPCDHP